MENKFIIRYSLEFFDDLDEITMYIKKELKNEIAANRLIKKVENSIKNRQESANYFEQYKTSKGYSYYRIYVDNFIIFYTITNNTMEIRNIKYSKRDRKNLI